MQLKQWEGDNQKDSKPSAAMQAIIKSILDKTGSETPAAEVDVEREHSDTLQDLAPDDTGPEEETPTGPADG